MTKNTTKQIALQLNLNTDKDILAKLDSVITNKDILNHLSEKTSKTRKFNQKELMQIDIERGYVRAGGKTKAGTNRIVPIHSAVMPYFKYFYNLAKSKQQKYLFVNSRGMKIDISNFRKRVFYPTLEDLGILEDEYDRHLTPYSTRHTFATLCDRADIDDNLLIKMMGHTTKKTTERFYIHKTEKDMKEAIETLKIV